MIADKALEKLQYDADEGDLRAQINAALLFELNLVDDVAGSKKAFHYWQKAAKNGSSWAKYNLGHCYEKGYGVTKDLQLAKTWFRKAKVEGCTGYEDPVAQLQALQCDVKPKKKASILVVDDNPSDLKVLNKILEEKYVIQQAGSAKEAFKNLKQTQDFSLVIVDINMPEIDGLALVERLRRQPELYLLPVIFVSGTKDIQTLKKAKKLGAFDIILKPITKDRLLFAARNAVDLAAKKNVAPR